MFQDCTSLTTVPEQLLPATTLAEGCYNKMFGQCTSLTAAPALCATTLVDRCYDSMFNGCTNLSSVTCLATNISATDCTSNWLYKVATKGTFTINKRTATVTANRADTENISIKSLRKWAIPR